MFKGENLDMAVTMSEPDLDPHSNYKINDIYKTIGNLNTDLIYNGIIESFFRCDDYFKNSFRKTKILKMKNCIWNFFQNNMGKIT